VDWIGRSRRSGSWLRGGRDRDGVERGGSPKVRTGSLFSGGSLGDVVDTHHRKLKEEVEGFDRNYILNTAPDAVVEYLVAKYRLDTPVLQDAITAEQEEAPVDVTNDFRFASFPGGRNVIPGTAVRFFVPFTGDPDLFKFRPSSYTSHFPRGEVRGSELVIERVGVDLTPESVRAELDRELASIRQYLSWIADAAKQFNDTLPDYARGHIDARRQRLLSAAGMVANLGFPLRARPGEARTFAPSEVRRKLVPPPAASNAPFVPEAALSPEQYEHILGVLRSTAHVLERSPKTFAHMEEEDLRCQFLVQLNGHYEGQATGETFNAEGKTDILVRSGDRNVFIAECKVWRGPAEFTKAIDQLLGYLTWRDTKAALLVFNRQKNFTAVLEKIPPAFRAHSYFRREVQIAEESSFRFIAASPSDPAREIMVTVLAFDVPS
jgi:hypothetical protein